MRMAGNERGETMLELLVAVVIMGLALVAIIGGLVTSTLVSDTHRKQATAGTYARDYAEAIQTAVSTGSVLYTGCASTSKYASPPGFAVPGGYQKSVVGMRYWTGTSWQATCSSDSGLQQVTVQVASDDGRGTERLTLTLRKPCGPGSSC